MSEVLNRESSRIDSADFSPMAMRSVGRLLQSATLPPPPPASPPFPLSPPYPADSRSFFQRMFCDEGDDVYQCGPSFGQAVTAGVFFLFLCVLPCCIKLYRVCCKKKEDGLDYRTSTTAVKAQPASIELRITEESTQASAASH